MGCYGTGLPQSISHVTCHSSNTPLNDSFSTRGTDTGPIIGHLSTEVQGHVPSTHIRVMCIDMYCGCMYMEEYRHGAYISFDIHHGTQASSNTI